MFWTPLPILREFRRELDVTRLDCPPAGLVIMRNLDSESEALMKDYDETVAKHRNITLENFGLDRFREESLTTSSHDVFQPAAPIDFLSSGGR